MQLHACLLLLIVITTDKTLALPDHHCGGNLSLDQKPTGSLNLTLPGVHHRDGNLSLCAWLLDVPAGRTTVLRLEQLDGGSNVSVRCVGPGGDHERVLESGREAPLSGCEGNKATLTWMGAGPSSAELSYHVQEDERNSSGARATHRPDRGLVTKPQTGTSFTRTAPVSQGVVSGENGGRGHLNESWEGSRGPWTVSGLSTEDQGPPHPATPLQGLALTGGADRETLPLPEEAANNGADTSGTAHPADSPVSAREGTHAYFHTRHSLGAVTSNTDPYSSARLVPTQTALTDAAASGSSTTMAAEIHEHADAHGREATRAQPQPPSQTIWGGGPSAITYGGAVGQEKQPASWRNTNTNTLSSDMTSAVTSDPATPPTKPPLDDSGSSHAETEADSSSSRGPSRARPSTAHMAELHTSAGTATAASLHPNASGADSYESTTSDAMELRTSTSSPSLQSTGGFTRSAHTSATFAETTADAQTATQGHSFSAFGPTSAVSSSPDVSTGDGETTSFTDSSSASGATLTLGDVFRSSSDTVTAAGPHRLRPTHAPFREIPSTSLQTSLPPVQSSTSMYSSAPSHTLPTHTADLSHTTHTPLPLTSFPPAMSGRTSTTESSPSHTPNHLSPSSSSPKQPHTYVTAARAPFHARTTAESDLVGNKKQELETDDESRRLFPTSTSTNTPTAGPAPTSRSTLHRSNVTATSSSVTTTPPWSSTSSRPPKYYIVPDQPAAIKVETIELLLQIILEESGSADAVGLEEDVAVWLRPYLQNAPGFSRLLGVWSSGHAVQNLVEFKTSGALQWLGATGPASLLERTGLAQAVREARGFRSSQIVNVTLGGQQGEVCDWLLRCPAGYQCVSQPGTANYSCSSLCHVDYCHHHGICTHHPDQLPVCRCLVGDFWYMGQRCDVRMTRARLVGTYLAILLIIVIIIGVLALVAVRRYRAILIQAKVDQTRSSYRRFNHFDELSGRFWLRSWAGSADSLDNPAFTRSDELLHLRALDRPCCYHDDTLSLASTNPSHGARINTIYPHSSQYAWRGSEMSVGDGVLDSGKASDLSVCSWPVEPIQWTPFPLLQQLASHRTPTVRVARPRSYCEGMELVDLEKSWTA